MQMTLRQAVTSAARKLEAVPPLAPTASRDAELLLLHTLDLPRTTLYAYPGRLLSALEQTAYDHVISRRLTCEPVQYITGTQEFFGLALRVTPATLIPRPETELLVEAALNRLPRDRPLRIADIGTGTGAIAIALATRLPLARILAIDLSPEALAVARANAITHGVADRIDFLESDLLTTILEPNRTTPPPTSRTAPFDAVLNPDRTSAPFQTSLPFETSAPFDAILSNPPYVPETDRLTLHHEVRDHEPAEALFAGPTGLDIYRRLIPQAAAALTPRGLLALEIGYGQRQPLNSLLAGWRGLRFLDDLQGIPRVVLARRP